VPAHRLTAFSAGPPERVFDLWTNLDRMGEWVRGVTKVTDVSGPIDRVGTRYIVWFGPVKSPTVVLDAERARYFKTRFGSWLLRGTNSTTFEPEGNGTRITEEFVTEGWVSAITSRLFGIGSYKGSYQGELNEFAKLAEREGSAPPTEI
jgi:uncharacterized protein YndB with AHSA1/START domain